MRILVITSEWPSQEYPNAGIFVVRQVEVMRQLGIKIDVLNFRGQGSPLKYFKALVKMRHLLGMHKYDLIHAHFGQAGFLAVLQKRLPVVVTFHGSDLYGIDETGFIGKFRSSLLRLVSTVAAKKATEVITVSKRLADLLPSRPHHTIPIGINLDMFRPMSSGKAREYLGWPKSERSILFIGDPSNRIKRYDLAQEAVALARKKIPTIRLRCCYNKKIDQIPYYMNASDVLVVTSSHEAGPLVVREAIACNLPVVSVDVGDVRQRIGNIEGCVVCEDDRAGTISEALVQVLERNVEMNASETVLELDEGRISEKILAVYALALKL